MISALIVDDELLTVRMLENTIDWNSYGIQVIATAQSGEQALALYRNYQVELIITDINMPGMNGIEFIKQVREINKETRIILLSGFGEFQYAKQALKYGASAYILKPMDEMELDLALKEVINEISSNKKTQKMIQQNKNISRSRLIKGFMKKMVSENSLHGIASELRFHFDNYMLFSINIENETMNEFMDISNLLHSKSTYIQDSLSHVLLEYGDNIILEFEEDSWYILISHMDMDQAPHCAQNMIRAFLETFAIKSNVCFSSIYHAMNELPIAYEEVEKLKRLNQYTNNGSVLGHGYNYEATTFDKLQMIEDEKTIVSYILSGKIVSARERLVEILQHTIHITPSSLDDVYDFCFNILAEIRKYLLEEKYISSISNVIMNVNYQDLLKLSSIDQLTNFMVKMINSISTLGTNGNSSINKLVEKSIQYLEDHYSENISLEEVCEYVAMSKNYFCYLFKRETGKSMWVLLTEIRMEKARYMLEHTDMKSYEISYNIGYDNPSYFSKLFKKMHAMTPNEYKNKHSNITK
ncbi:response regulator [Paenibacillus anaericanus]|uniref:Response regulator n=1 Tax=Paenibacillus anaericanus TaxID=170367 RepID=A0A433Y783_9BACL|nr:response regulator [Paenibacillus anaericanus]RUT45228.1 response regulator [Paenibacillus anaericanus]